MYIWHLKLEHGTIATSWNMSPDDVEENSNLRINNLDAYLV
jgi:hypothetical protein